MKKILSLIVFICVIAILSCWKISETELAAEQKQQKTSVNQEEKKKESRFIIVDSIEDARTIEKVRSMPESETPQNIPNADPDSSIIIVKLPETNKGPEIKN